MGFSCVCLAPEMSIFHLTPASCLEMRSAQENTEGGPLPRRPWPVSGVTALMPDAGVNLVESLTHLSGRPWAAARRLFLVKVVGGGQGFFIQELRPRPTPPSAHSPAIL